MPKQNGRKSFPFPLYPLCPFSCLLPPPVCLLRSNSSPLPRPSPIPTSCSSSGGGRRRRLSGETPVCILSLSCSLTTSCSLQVRSPEGTPFFGNMNTEDVIGDAPSLEITPHVEDNTINGSAASAGTEEVGVPETKYLQEP